MTTQTLQLSLAQEQDCAPCRDRVLDALRSCDGVLSASLAGGSVLVAYDPEVCGEDALAQAAGRVRTENEASFDHHQVKVTGMDCADCATRIQAATRRLPSVTNAEVNLTAEQLRLELHAGADLESARELVERLGYGFAAPADDAAGEAASQKLVEPSGLVAEWLEGSDRLTAVSAALLVAAALLEVVGAAGGFRIAAYALSIVVGGASIARSGVRAAIATRAPDMNLLMAIAVVGAAAIGAWTEASLVVVLFSVGELLERRAVGRARRQLASLVALTPATAHVLRAHQHADGTTHDREEQIRADQINVGDRLAVRPGERIPADADILEGASAIDQSAVTGESMPVDRVAGDSVFAGTLNGQGKLVVQATSAAGSSTVDRIAALVREAQARRSPSERWVSAFARRYTPLVIVAALVVGVAAPAAGVIEWSAALYAALALLILACPCALVLSTPVTIVSALGRASAAGVLVKGGEHLEQAARIDTVAFDKTGTLTAGHPEVVAVETAGDSSPDELLGFAAAVEGGSEHPLAQAITRYARGQQLAHPVASDVTASVGRGASGTVDGALVRVGAPAMFADLPPAIVEAIDRHIAQGRTVVVVEAARRPLGVIALADQPRATAKQTIADLAALGITQTLMLSGDNHGAATAIANELGISQVHAGLMPQDKQRLLSDLPGTVAMVGDGINDAPALALADLGVAMGTGGSDTAIEVADVALIGDDPTKLPALIGLARWTRTVVRQNIGFSLATKAVAAALLAAGMLPLWGAVATDVGASLIVVANGLRIVHGTPSGRARRLPLLASRPPLIAGGQGA